MAEDLRRIRSGDVFRERRGAGRGDRALPFTFEWSTLPPLSAPVCSAIDQALVASLTQFEARVRVLVGELFGELVQRELYLCLYDYGLDDSGWTPDRRLQRTRLLGRLHGAHRLILAATMAAIRPNMSDLASS